LGGGAKRELYLMEPEHLVPPEAGTPFW